MSPRCEAQHGHRGTSRQPDRHLEYYLWYSVPNLRWVFHLPFSLCCRHPARVSVGETDVCLCFPAVAPAGPPSGRLRGRALPTDAEAHGADGRRLPAARSAAVCAGPHAPASRLPRVCAEVCAVYGRADSNRTSLSAVQNHAPVSQGLENTVKHERPCYLSSAVGKLRDRDRGSRSGSHKPVSTAAQICPFLFSVLLSAASCELPATRYQIPDTRCQIPCITYQVSYARSCHMPCTMCHVPCTMYHVP